MRKALFMFRKCYVRQFIIYVNPVYTFIYIYFLSGAPQCPQKRHSVPFDAVGYIDISTRKLRLPTFRD
jgi:hypothetical protein